MPRTVRPRHRQGLVPAVASTLLGAILVLLAAAPAHAHPFGPPPTALVAVRGNAVLVEWRSAPDDAIAIGIHVGLLPEETMEAYLGVQTQVAPSAADEETLARSPELHGYLLEHIQILQDGQRCEPHLEPVGDFVHEGARVIHECPTDVEAVEVEITMLHDVHSAYRTFAIAEDDSTVPAQAVFTVAQPRQRMDFTGTGPEAANPAGTAAGDTGTAAGLAALGAITLAAAAAGIVLARRGRDRRAAAPQ
jgi:hypothetical protein